MHGPADTTCEDYETALERLDNQIYAQHSDRDITTLQYCYVGMVKDRVANGPRLWQFGWTFDECGTLTLVDKIRAKYPDD